MTPSFSTATLKRAQIIVEKIEKLEAELAQLLEGTPTATARKKAAGVPKKSRGARKAVEAEKVVGSRKKRVAKRGSKRGSKRAAKRASGKE
ncbi:MAG: hypothetical protein RLZZ253_870 [Verrucomicrobiota bacterium]|jgi:hypothetical protein